MNSLVLLARIIAIGSFLGILLLMSMQGSFWNLKLRRLSYALLIMFIVSACFLAVQFFSR
jgi:hypothetical protein